MKLGYADLHCHPMAHLAFGGERKGRSLFWGEPMAPIAEALPSCAPAHGFLHQSGGVWRLLPLILDHELAGGGFDSFSNWPRFHTRIHQQMHIMQVYRAYRSGLRLMVACAVNNELLADKYHGVHRSNSDASVIDAQLDGIAAMVEANRHWMTIVRRPEDAWSALNNNKLVVILGIEVDSIAGPEMRWDGQLAIEDVDAIVEGWWNKGVRLLHPVHLADNALGGTAVYNDYFNFLNHYLIKKHARRQGSSWFLQVEDAAEHVDTEDIRFKLGSPLAYSLAYDWRGRYRPSYPDASHQSGHVNRRGLSEAGEAFLLSMMRRGMLIDVEHMSNRTLHDALRIATRFRYPLFSTHTAIRSLAVTPPKDGSFTDGCAHEAMRSDEDLMAIQELGGMLGIGCHLGLTKGLDVDASTSWTRAYQYAVHELGFTSVGIGTDMNGFAQAPGPRFGGDPVSPSPRWKRDPIRHINYGSDTIPLSSKVLDQAGLGRRSFDFNFDGLAHYGLLPDFTVDVALSLGYRSPLTTQREMTPFFTSANAVVAAWSTCVTQSRALGLQQARRPSRVEEGRAWP